MFKKYNSIENSYRIKEIEMIKNSKFHNEKFCVTEKVDGANFSAIIDKDGNVKYAKRSGLLNENESFYNWEQIADNYEENFKKIGTFLCSQNNCNTVQIFGELYGNKVQKRVKYLPKDEVNEFIMFDIRMNFDEGDEGYSQYIPFNQLEIYSENFKIPLVPNLFEGSFEECLEYKNDYDSILARENGVEVENNITEGNVIRPYEIDGKVGNNRVILKNKNEKFKEKKNKGKKIVKLELTEDQKKFIEEGSKYITESRLHGLFSKGEVKKDWKQFNKISGLYIKDLWEDFEKDNEEVTKLSKADKKIIRREIQALANEMIREFLKKEI